MPRADVDEDEGVGGVPACSGTSTGRPPSLLTEARRTHAMTVAFDGAAIRSQAQELVAGGDLGHGSRLAESGSTHPARSRPWRSGRGRSHVAARDHAMVKLGLQE